jgi:hypothetical protein
LLSLILDADGRKAMKVVVLKSPKALKGILRMIFKIKKED